MQNKWTDLSRLISHALRHEPWLYELELDNEGWTDLATLIDTLRRQSSDWGGLTEQDLEEMIRISSKQRHEISDGRIRALYGHSLPGKLRRMPAPPPACLFHGTASFSVSSIMNAGLLPMGRQYVHLSVDRETAHAVGSRKSKNPEILCIRALAAFESGTAFYVGNDRVWLADMIPAAFIDPLPNP